MPTSDFETRLRELAARAPNASLAWALEQLDGGRHIAGFDPVHLAEYAFESEPIMQHCRDGKKINAIKLMRELTQIGLKEAKDAVELAWSWRELGRLTRAEQDALEAEEQQAIKSILGAS